jgi:hypothetical protein
MPPHSRYATSKLFPRALSRLLQWNFRNITPPDDNIDSKDTLLTNTSSAKLQLNNDVDVRLKSLYDLVLYAIVDQVLTTD